MWIQSIVGLIVLVVFGFCRAAHKKVELHYLDTKPVDCLEGHIDIYDVELIHLDDECIDRFARFKNFVKRTCQDQHQCEVIFSVGSLRRENKLATSNCTEDMELTITYECIDDEDTHTYSATERKLAMIMGVCIFVIGVMIGILIGCRHRLCPSQRPVKPDEVGPASYVANIGASGSRDNLESLENIRYMAGAATFNRPIIGSTSEGASGSISDTSSNRMRSPGFDFSRQNTIEDQIFYSKNSQSESPRRKYFEYDPSGPEIQLGAGRQFVEPYAISSVPLDSKHLRHVPMSADDVRRLPDIVESPPLPGAPPFSDHTYECIGKDKNVKRREGDYDNNVAPRPAPRTKQLQQFEVHRWSANDLEVSIPAPMSPEVSLNLKTP